MKMKILVPLCRLYYEQLKDLLFADNKKRAIGCLIQIEELRSATTELVRAIAASTHFEEFLAVAEWALEEYPVQVGDIEISYGNHVAIVNEYLRLVSTDGDDTQSILQIFDKCKKCA